MYESPPPLAGTPAAGAPPLWSWLLTAGGTALIGSQVQITRSQGLAFPYNVLVFAVGLGLLVGFLWLMARLVWKGWRPQTNAHIIPFYMGFVLADFYSRDSRILDFSAPRTLLLFTLVGALFITLGDDLYFKRYQRSRWRWSLALLLAMLVILPLSLQVRRLGLPALAREVLGVLLVALVYGLISGLAVTRLPLRPAARAPAPLPASPQDEL
jgi:hypothetical protein